MNIKRKVLIAEDDRSARRMLEHFLAKWGYDVLSASDGKQAWEVLQGEDAPKLALLDWMMPGVDGVQLCREIRKRSAQLYVYVLLLTAKTQKQEILEGLDAGADDYLVKPYNADELRARLRVGERIIDLQSQLMAATDAMRFQASHDSLTGLNNRAAVLEILERELARSRRDGNPVGIVVVDLDHFKQINDLHGHLAGDAVLRETARRMATAVRAYDSVGRYGGEEFVIVFPNCDASASFRQAERIRDAIKNQPVSTPEGPLEVTASMGVVTTEFETGADAHTLLRAADAALYRAKRAGRDRVEAAAPADREAVGKTIPALEAT